MIPRLMTWLCIGVMVCRLPAIGAGAITSHVLMTDTTSPVSWSIVVVGKVSGLEDSSATFGVRPDATSDFDVKYDRPCPPNPPGDWLQVFFPHTGGNWPTLLGTRFSADFSEPVSPTWILNVETTLGSGSVTLSWDTAALGVLPRGYEILMRDSVTGDTIRMRRQRSYVFQYTSLRVFTIWTTYDASFIPIEAGWNLLSVPRVEADPSKRGLFPTAISVAFGYDGSYVISDVLEPCRGYWLKFDQGLTVTFNGTPSLIDTIGLREGWNMIGSLSVSIPIGSIASIPPGVTTSRFFDYEGTYRQADSIIPGRGYWVRVYQACSLVLSPGSMNPPDQPRVGAIAGLPPPPPGDAAGTPELLPRELTLSQNYPNPFNPSTTIRYTLPEESNISLVLADVLGRDIAVLEEGVQQPGLHTLRVDCGALRLSGGVYYYRLTGAGIATGREYREIRKLIFMK